MVTGRVLTFPVRKVLDALQPVDQVSVGDCLETLHHLSLTEFLHQSDCVRFGSVRSGPSELLIFAAEHGKQLLIGSLLRTRNI